MLSKTDQAKFPVVPEAVEYVKKFGLTIDDLVDESYGAILDRAEERLKQAISQGLVSSEWHDDEIEILSFPVAVYLTTILQDDWVKRRYALAESKRASQLLFNEDIEKIAEVASNAFHWKIDTSQTKQGKRTQIFRIGFKNYIRNAVRIREPKWKLINRLVDRGYVQVGKDEVTRLLQEEVQGRVLERMKGPASEAPDFLKSRVEGLKKFILEKRGVVASQELPKVAVFSAMPPCIRNLYDSAHSGKHISHIGRFALTSFLVNIGASQEDVLKLFNTASDFDAKKTRYQVEHIAGGRGRKTAYTPPKCATLRTHGLCVSPDEICKQINHPLSYYKRRVRAILPKERRYAGR